MKVIIAGTRTVPQRIAEELVALAAQIAELRGWEITEVVCGAARGVDSAGEAWALRHKIPVKYFKADWSKGRGAGLARNVEMANYAEALIAITTGSPGTRHMITTARARKMPMIVIAMSGGFPWLAEAA